MDLVESVDILELAFLAHLDIQDLADIQAAVFLDILDLVVFQEQLDHKVYLVFQDLADILGLVFLEHLDTQDSADILDQALVDIQGLVESGFQVQLVHKAHLDIQGLVAFQGQLGHKVHQDIQAFLDIADTADQE